MWRKHDASSPKRVTTSLIRNVQHPVKPEPGTIYLKHPTPSAHVIVGHRGSSANYPENTFLAFDKAIEEGATAIETDILKTSDGEFVLMHDTTVDRTTDGTGSVEDLTWDYISGLDAGAWKGSEFAGLEDTKVPRLKDFLERYKDKSVYLFLQFKTGINGTLEGLQIVADMNMFEQCFIFTSKSNLSEIRRTYPEAQIINDGSHSDMSGLIEQAVEENWNAVSNNPDNITSEKVTQAHKDDIIVQGSSITSDFASETQSCLDKGINFIVGDDCSAMVQVLKDNGINQTTPLYLRDVELEIYDGYDWIKLS